MTTGQYPHWTPGSFIVKRWKLSLFGYVCLHNALPNIILQGTADGMVVVTEEDHLNHGGTTTRNGQASHCCRCGASQTIEVDGQPL